jgi:hypothetical protein
MTAWTLPDGQGAERSDASGMSCGFTPPIAVFTGNVQQRHLPRAFETGCGPLGTEGRSLMENMPFGRFSGGLHCGLAAIFAGLEFAGLLFLMHLQPKSQATPPANLAALCPSVAAEWDRLAAVQIRIKCCSFRCRR